MKVKDGDVIEFLAISWDEFHWEFDHPTVILKPVISYSPNGESCDRMIEDMAINFCCNEDLKDEDVSVEFDWRRWKLSTLRRVAKERLAGKTTWKTKIREVIKSKVRFFTDDSGELQFKIIDVVKV